MILVTIDSFVSFRVLSLFPIPKLYFLNDIIPFSSQSLLNDRFEYDFLFPSITFESISNILSSHSNIVVFNAFEEPQIVVLVYNSIFSNPFLQNRISDIIACRSLPQPFRYISRDRNSFKCDYKGIEIVVHQKKLQRIFIVSIKINLFF